ncbi:MAG TPA: hypothetical protein VFY45_06910 [Baekduia sp.]|nr:hypothetical protein [Baekduia sp.]
MASTTKTPAPLGTSRLGTFVMLVFAIVSMSVIGFGVATGLNALFVPKNETEPTTGPDVYAWDGSPPRIPITVPDPGGHEPWAVQIYRAKAGNPCLRVGRLHRNDRGITDFGRVDPDGSFHRLDIEDNGSPTDLSDEPQALIINHFIRTGMAAIYGIVTSKVTKVTLELGSEIRELPIAGGTYLGVRQDADLQGGAVHFAYRDGTTKTMKLRWTPPASLAPPSGLRP